MDAKTRKIERLSDYESGASLFELTNDKVIFAKTEVANPSELYMADLTMKNSVKLSAQ